MFDRKPHVLLVDDVDFFLEMEQNFLKRTPALLYTARNGREALDCIEERRPDLIYMDVNMPVMDGLACCRIIKNDHRLRSIPIIMVFAPSRDASEAACRDAGCDAVVTKPIDRKKFLELGHSFLFQIDRRVGRIPCQMTVEFVRAGEKKQGMGVDINENGMYIQSRDEVREKEGVTLFFHLPTITSERIEIRGRIAWVNQGFPRPQMAKAQGFGVEFGGMDSFAEKSIREYIAREQNVSESLHTHPEEGKKMKGQTNGNSG